MVTPVGTQTAPGFPVAGVNAQGAEWPVQEKLTGAPVRSACLSLPDAPKLQGCA